MRETVWAAEKIMVLPPCVKYRVRMESKKRWRWWWVNADKKKFFWVLFPRPLFPDASGGGGGGGGEGKKHYRQVEERAAGMEKRGRLFREGVRLPPYRLPPPFSNFFCPPCSRGKEKRGCVGSTGATVSGPPPAIQRGHTMRPPLCVLFYNCACE